MRIEEDRKGRTIGPGSLPRTGLAKHQPTDLDRQAQIAHASACLPAFPTRRKTGLEDEPAETGTAREVNEDSDIQKDVRVDQQKGRVGPATDSHTRGPGGHCTRANMQNNGKHKGGGY